MAVENATATKLDYFVDVAISDTVTIAPNGSATVDTAVTLTNHAPQGNPRATNSVPTTSIPSCPESTSAGYSCGDLVAPCRREVCTNRVSYWPTRWTFP